MLTSEGTEMLILEIEKGERVSEMKKNPFAETVSGTACGGYLLFLRGYYSEIGN